MERLYSQVCLSWTSCTDEYAFHADTTPAVKAALSFCVSCFSFWSKDEFASSFRKKLVLEQYRSAEMSRLHCAYLVSSPVEALTGLFRSFNVTGAAEKAFSLYSAIYFSFGIYDGAEDKLCTYFILKESIERRCFDIFGNAV